MEENYKKSYALFILWIILYCAMMTLVCFIPVGAEAMIKFLGVSLMVGLDLLFLLIYKTEYIYWINGVSYEEAKEAGSEQRKEYARRILKLFLIATLCFIGYVAVGLYIGTSTALDTFVEIAVVVIPAFGMIRIKL